MPVTHNVYENTVYPPNQLFSHVRQPIVVVDDSRDDRQLLANALMSILPTDKPIISLSSGRDLLDYLLSVEMENIEATEFEVEIPDMIFLDLLMPSMDGIKTLEAIRGQSIWADVPVTLITGSRDDVAIKQAEDAGANAFLPKPFTRFDVTKALNKGNNFSSSII